MRRLDLGAEGEGVCAVLGRSQASAAHSCGIKCRSFCTAGDNPAGNVVQGRYKMWRCAVAH